MDTRPVDQLTLRELLRESEFICRELVDHLERHFVPRAENLARLIRPKENAEIDVDVPAPAVQTHAQAAIESDTFTRNVFDRFHLLIKSLDASVSRVIGEE